MRSLWVLLALALSLAPAAPEAQQQRLHRIGYLTAQPAADTASGPSAMTIIEQELRRLGYVDGKNVVYERRFADGDLPRLSSLAVELVQLGVEVIIAQTTTAALAAKRVSSRVPIVFIASGDAVGSGLVASLARPGGNATGNSFLGTELATKQLELLREMVPGVRRVALVANDALPPERLFFEAMRRSAEQFDMDIVFVDMRGPDDFERGVAQVSSLGAQAAIYPPGGYTDRAADRARLLKAGAGRDVPAVFFRREFVDEGALISYGPSFPAMYRQAAAYVDRILKGANPADLPVLQPTHFELVVNQKTAKAKGIALPDSVLARADEVIE